MNYGKNWVIIFHYYYDDWIGPKKKRFLKFYGKFRHICRIFCMKLQHHKDLKLPQMFLSWGKTLFWILVKPKIVNNPGLQTH